MIHPERVAEDAGEPELKELLDRIEKEVGAFRDDPVSKGCVAPFAPVAIEERVNGSSDREPAHASPARRQPRASCRRSAPCGDRTSRVGPGRGTSVARRRGVTGAGRPRW